MQALSVWVVATSARLYIIADEMEHGDVKMHTLTARVLVLALVAMLGTGCATTAKAPKYRDLRPLNQDLVAWLDRLNAQPPATVTPQAPAQAPTVPLATAVPDKGPAVVLRPSPSAPAETPAPLLSRPVPSPTAASTSLATAAPSPTPVPAVAVAAGASSSPAGAAASPPLPTAPAAISPSAAPATVAHSPTPGETQPPAPSTLVLAPPADPVPAAGATAIPPAEAPKPSVVVTPLPPPKPVWVAGQGSTLRSAVEQWSGKADWTVIWDASIDYPIVGTLRYRGDYLDAVRQIFQAHAGAERPLRADAYTRQKLIHITE